MISHRSRIPLSVAIVFLGCLFGLLSSMVPGGSAIATAQDLSADEAFDAQKEKFEAEKSSEDFLRHDTIIGFGEIDSRKTVPFLAELLESETNPAIHAAIGKALGELGTASAVQLLVTGVLPRLTGPEHLNLWEQVEAALKKEKEERAERWLLQRGLTPEVRSDPKAHRAVLEAIASTSSDARFRVLKSELSRSRDPQVIAAILNIYRDQRPRSAAREVARFATSKEPEVQVAALEVLHALEATTRTYVRLYTRLLKSPSWKARVLSVDLLSMANASDLLELLVPLLDDENDRVRIACVAAMVNLGTKDVIDPLIDALGKNEGRVKDDILDALIRLTGKNLGYIPIQWKSWWSQQQLKADIQKRPQEEFTELKVAEDTSEATAVYHGIRVLSNKATFLVDGSKSMADEYAVKPPSAPGKKGRRGRTAVDDDTDAKEKEARKRAKINVAKEELHQVLKNLSDGVLLNIIRFDTFISPWRPKMEELDPKTRPQLTEFVNALTPQGLTNVYDALELAFKDDRMDTIYLLSDGAPTMGAHKETEAILRAVADLNRLQKVKINTIGFNLKPHERELMANLAEQNFGIFISR